MTNPSPPDDAVTLVEAEQSDDPRRPIFRLVLLMAAILLTVLPFVTTFNEFLTRIVESLGLDVLLTRWVVPWEVRLIAAVLGLVGIGAQVTQGAVVVEKGSMLIPVYISWNCVGWQSFILFLATLLTGMQGPFSRRSKVETVLVGLLGTFLVNLLRISSVIVIAYSFGQLPATIYHDYAGTLIILAWLFGFWWFSHGWLLEPMERVPEEPLQERYLRDVHPAVERE